MTAQTSRTARCDAAFIARWSGWGVKAMAVWIIIGAVVALLVVADLADLLLARAGKRSVLHRRLRREQDLDARNAHGEAAGRIYTTPGG